MKHVVRYNPKRMLSDQPWVAFIGYETPLQRKIVADTLGVEGLRAVECDCPGTSFDSCHICQALTAWEAAVKADPDMQVQLKGRGIL